MTSITIPNSVTSIGLEAFNECTGLTSILVNSNNKKYDSRNNCNAIIVTATNTLIYGCKNTVIPNSVTSIEGLAFDSCSGLTSITIPNSVTSIGREAFKGCSGLTSITIPNSVTSIEWGAFNGCSGLTSILVNSNNKKYDSRNNCNAIIETATNTLIYGCKNTVIPNSVTSIGKYAFYYCSGLTSITIPNSVTSIVDYAFSGCSSLPVVNNIRYADTYLVETVDKTLATYNIKEGTRFIGDHAFQGCSGLTSITIPNSVTSIGESAFYQCSSLPVVNNIRYADTYLVGTVDKTLATYNIKEGTRFIGSNAFTSCTYLTSITIPNSVTSIGNYAFKGCSGLTSITIPNSVTSIGKYAFYECSGLTSITIPNSVTSIVDYAFSGCSGLTSITIPNSVTSIGEDAFYDCSGLTSITIPNSVISIGDAAFNGCTGLTSITIPNSVTGIGDKAFYGCSGLTSIYVYWNQPLSIDSNVYSYMDLSKVTLHVPSGTKSKYQSADVWKEFGTIKEFDIPITDIPITSISLDKTSASIHPDESITLFATISPENATNTTISWKSSGTNIATVSNGIVTGINVGKATITATTTDDTDLSTSCEIIVTPIPILTKSISLNKSTAEMIVDDNLTLSATITPSNATNKDVEWSSSDNSIATVDNGIVKAIKVGTVTITAKTTDGSNLSASCTITVKGILVNTLSLNTGSAELVIGISISLVPIVLPDNATNQKLEWSSSDDGVAKVSDGIVTAVSQGDAVITAKTTDGSNLSATCNIKVVPISIYVSSVSLSKTSIDLLVEENATITATVYPDNASNPTLAWSSSDENVATVNGGKVTATGEGTATITARTVDGSDLSATCTVNVSRHSQSITWNQDLSNLTYGSELITLQATSSSGLPVSYKSSDDNVATIFDMGFAIYLNPGIAGTATITARQEGNNYYAPAEMTKVANVVQPDNVNGVNAVNGRYTVYTATGTKIGTYNESEFRKLIDSHKLSGGLYIINGGKIIIK